MKTKRFEFQGLCEALQHTQAGGQDCRLLCGVDDEYKINPWIYHLRSSKEVELMLSQDFCDAATEQTTQGLFP